MKNLHKKKTLVFSTFFLLIFVSVAVGQQKPHDTETAERVARTNEFLKPVEEYVLQIEEFVKKEDKPHFVIADSGDENDERAVWERFASENDFERAQEKAPSYTSAYVWQKDGKTVAVKLTLSSPSGDWVQFVSYIFDSNGTLAKIDSTLNTFYGDASVLRTFWFAADGKLLMDTVSYLDLESEKPFDPKERDFLDRDVDIYKKVTDLPFARLLKTEAN